MYITDICFTSPCTQQVLKTRRIFEVETSSVESHCVNRFIRSHRPRGAGIGWEIIGSPHT